MQILDMLEWGIPGLVWVKNAESKSEELSSEWLDYLLALCL